MTMTSLAGDFCHFTLQYATLYKDQVSEFNVTQDRGLRVPHVIMKIETHNHRDERQVIA